MNEERQEMKYMYLVADSSDTQRVECRIGCTTCEVKGSQISKWMPFIFRNDHN